MYEREAAVILCGLRMLQRELMKHGHVDGDLADILTNAAEFEPPTPGGIDRPCALVNRGSFDVS